MWGGDFSNQTGLRGQSWSIATGLRLLADSMAQAALAERDRWALWLPVLFGFGMAVNFALPFDAPVQTCAVFFIGLLAAILLAHFIGAARAALVLLAPLMVSAGMLLVAVASSSAATPTLSRSLVLGGLSGMVVAVEAFPDGARVRLEDLSAPLHGRTGWQSGWRNGWRGETPPQAVRVKLRAGAVPLIGSRIQLTARLSPPPRPSYPGAFDFARAAWFDGLGAVGFALSDWRVVAQQSDPGPWIRAQNSLAGFRIRLSQRVQALLPGDSGAVAAALLTGDRTAVPEAVLEDLRQSGLAHLLAISGLHIGMVSLIIFVTLRAALALRQSWARDRPIKKWAALAAMIGSFGYLLLAGATVPTQRAFVMTGIVLVAVLTDRQAISMRLVAVAAMLVLLIAPVGIVGASFQLSFAAVVALVAVYESYKPGFGDGRQRDGWQYRVLFYLAAVCLTSLVAGVATAPLAIHHFGRIAHYSVLANLFAIPIVTFIVMPMELLSLLVMPAGLADLPLAVAGWGIDAVLWIAHTTASLPGATGVSPPMPGWGFACVTLGGLWCAIWRRRWRYLSLPVIAAGLASPLTQPVPLVLLHEAGNQAAIVWHGKLWVETARREKFSLSVWSEKTALPIAGTWQALAETPGSPLRCDPLGCLFRVDTATQGEVAIAFAADPRAIPEDCRRADAVRVPIQPHPALCRDHPALGPADLLRGGTHVLYLRSGGDAMGDRLRVDTVERQRGDRYWSR